VGPPQGFEPASQALKDGFPALHLDCLYWWLGKPLLIVRSLTPGWKMANFKGITGEFGERKENLLSFQDQSDSWLHPKCTRI